MMRGKRDEWGYTIECLRHEWYFTTWKSWMRLCDKLEWDVWDGHARLVGRRVPRWWWVFKSDRSKVYHRAGSLLLNVEDNARGDVVGDVQAHSEFPVATFSYFLQTRFWPNQVRSIPDYNSRKYLGFIAQTFEGTANISRQCLNPWLTDRNSMVICTASEYSETGICKGTF